MKTRKLYEEYHKNSRLQKRILSNSNFTYYYLIDTLNRNLKKVRNVLDIGCGTGAIDFYLAHKSIFVTGVDISKKAIQIAKKNSKKLNLDRKTKFVVSEFPYTKINKKYDLIICSEILEHIRDDSKAVEVVYKLLKSGGLAIFSSPSINAPAYKTGIAQKHDLLAGHLRRYNTSEYSKLISNTGFRIIKIERNQSFFRDILFMSNIGKFFIKAANRFGLISKILLLFDRLILPFGESDIMVVARKK